MIGYKSPDSYLVEMIRSVNINSIKIKSQQSKKVTGLKEKMKNWLSLFERTVLSNGVKLLLSLIQTLGLQGMVSNAERDGSTF